MNSIVTEILHMGKVKFSDNFALVKSGTEKFFAYCVDFLAKMVSRANLEILEMWWW